MLIANNVQYGYLSRINAINDFGVGSLEKVSGFTSAQRLSERGTMNLQTQLLSVNPKLMPKHKTDFPLRNWVSRRHQEPIRSESACTFKFGVLWLTVGNKQQNS